MAFYEFRREDNGETFERNFPVGKCPRFVICEDGVKACRIFTAPKVSMFSGNGTAFDASALNADMKRRNEAAGRRMKDTWPSVRQSG